MQETVTTLIAPDNHWALLAQQWNQRIGSFDIVDGQYVWGA